MRKQSLVGQKFGRLSVIADGPSKKNKSTSICICDCGNSEEIIVYNKYLKNGDTKSCGCLLREHMHNLNYRDLTGEKFGRLTVIRQDGLANDGHAMWLCRCSCGQIVSVLSNSLTSGKTKSCGCLKEEVTSGVGKITGPINVVHAQEAAKAANRTHGMTHSRPYRIWQMMHQRCENPNTTSWGNYGAKGIHVCAEWKSFESFYKWAIENGYSDDLTIDRLNPEKDYCPENCRWVTKSQNSERLWDGKARYWYLDAKNGIYAEFDTISAFLRRHPSIELNHNRIYRIANGLTEGIKEIQFGRIE